MEAITREEKLMSAASSGKSSGIKPITREEMFLSYIAGESKKKPKPITRKEMFLDKIESGGGGSAPEVMENIVFPEDTTGLPNVSVTMGGVTATYYLVADFIPLEKMQEAKLIYNFGGEMVGSSFEIGASLPSGSYSDSGLRVVSVIGDNETIPFEIIETEVTFPKTGTYFAYSADMGGALILEILFPDEVTALLEGTVKEITIPNEVTKLRAGGFVGCNKLKEINADESHKFYTSIDGILYTKDGKKLVSFPPAKEETEYIMPNSVEEVESMAFNGTTNLENVKLSDNIKSLPENLAIENKNAEIELVLNPDILVQGDVYPVGSPLITTVTIPEGSTYLSATAFDNMPNIENLYYNAECELEKVGVVDGKTTYYVNGIQKLQNLKKVVIGSGVKNIPDEFLNGLYVNSRKTLETLVIGENVETIGDKAFYYLMAVKDLEISNNVKSIGAEAFSNMESVEGTLVIPDSIVELCTRDESWGIVGAHFGNMEKITKVVIGKGLSELSINMFVGCDNLKEVVIPSNIKIIGVNAFSWCINLESVTIPDGVTSIGERAFEACGSLTNITIPGSVTTIGNMTFCDCISLTDVTLVDGIRNIPTGMFWGCTSLTNITIPNSVETIDYRAFLGCSNLAHIYILNNDCFFNSDIFEDASTNVEGGITIHGYAGSYAETFATENGFNFEVIEE